MNKDFIPLSTFPSSLRGCSERRRLRTVSINLLSSSICRGDWQDERSTLTQQAGGGGEGRKEHETSVWLAASVSELRSSSCKPAVEFQRLNMFFPIDANSFNINWICAKIGTALCLFLSTKNVEILASGFTHSLFSPSQFCIPVLFHLRCNDIRVKQDLVQDHFSKPQPLKF